MKLHCVAIWRTVRAAIVPLALGSIIPSALAGQQPAPRRLVTLTGRVTNAEGAPLSSASVVIQQLNLSSMTRADGSYAIVVPGARVPAAPVTVSARLLGFKPSTAQVRLTGATAKQDFTLAENPLKLGEIVVTGAGTVSEAEKIGPFSISELEQSCQSPRKGVPLRNKNPRN